VSRGGRSGASCKGKSVTRRMEEEFVGGAEEESRVVLWTNSATRCEIVGVGIARARSCRHVFEMLRMWRRRMPCER